MFEVFATDFDVLDDPVVNIVSGVIQYDYFGSFNYENKPTIPRLRQLEFYCILLVGSLLSP